MNQVALGIDIGGSGIKGAPVDVTTGELLAERIRYDTPQPSKPKAVAALVAKIAEDFSHILPPEAPVGVTFPGVIQHGVVVTSANLDKHWIECPAEALFAEALGRQCLVVNDADAAGVAEMKFGAAKDAPGLTIMTTLGTGIGSALLLDGRLVPNAELGHLELDGHDAETRAAASAREREGLTYAVWATERLQPYYAFLEFLFSPDLFVVGGGVSRKADKFLPLLQLRAPIVAAHLRNAAGIIGAAGLAADA